MTSSAHRRGAGASRPVRHGGTPGAIAPLALTALLGCVPAAAQTYVAGDITRDTTWRLSGSPYLVYGDVTVGGGAGLTIEPGVEVRFFGGTSLRVGLPTAGAGGLYADGEIAAPILFTSEAAAPAPGDWGGIVLGELAVDATYEPSSDEYFGGSILRECVVEYGGGGGAGGMLVMDGSAPYLSHVVMSRSAGSGLRALPVTGFPLRIEDCVFDGNGAAGISGGGAHIRGAAPAHLLRCSFLGNTAGSGGGMYLEAGASTILDCLFESNTAAGSGGGANVHYGARVTFRNCDFLDNRVEHPDGSGSSGGALVISANDTSIYDCRFMGNSVTGRAVQGGAVLGSAYRLFVADCLFEANSAVGAGVTARGGALRQYPDHIGHNILRCEFVGNAAFCDGGQAIGGAIEIGRARVQACRFEDNRADTVTGIGDIKGEAIAAQDEEFLAIGNRFAGNAAGSIDGAGGAVFQASEGAVYGANDFESNAAGRSGGAMHIDALCSLEGSALLFNRFLTNAAPAGSAVFNALPFDGYGYNDISAAYACWGTTDLGEIEVMVDHYFDDDSRSVVGYWPLADCGAVCLADWDDDGDVDSSDVLAMLGSFAARDPEADVNADGVVDTRDVILFLQLWAEAC